MKLVVVAVGNRMPGWITEGYAEYAKRMPRELPLNLVEVKPEPRSPAGGNRERSLAAEEKRITAQLPTGARRVVLDETGRELATRDLARQIARWQQSGGDVAFVIGGADGTTTALRGTADLVWSLSPLTLPHGLVRVVLAEQLYRAVSILKNHPYHRE